jgi:hypothetical protein
VSCAFFVRRFRPTEDRWGPKPHIVVSIGISTSHSMHSSCIGTHALQATTTYARVAVRERWCIAYGTSRYGAISSVAYLAFCKSFRLSTAQSSAPDTDSPAALETFHSPIVAFDSLPRFEHCPVERSRFCQSTQSRRAPAGQDRKTEFCEFHLSHLLDRQGADLLCDRLGASLGPLRCSRALCERVQGTRHLT